MEVKTYLNGTENYFKNDTTINVYVLNAIQGISDSYKIWQ